MNTFNLINDDCLNALKDIDENSIDSIITDPPYGLSKTPDIVEVMTKWLAGEDYKHRGSGFMGKSWDSFVPGPAVWRECFRVLKPGGHMIAFAGSRTYDLMAIACRMGGFEIRDQGMWLYGSGFPKSLDVSKAIDKRGGNLTAEIGSAIKKAREKRGLTKTDCDNTFCGGTTNWSWFEGRPAGQIAPTPETFARIVEQWPELTELSDAVKEAEREVVEKKKWSNSAAHFVPGEDHKQRVNLDETAAKTPEAQKYEGWGTALKPAHEPFVIARKPFKGTVADNVLEHGVGGINVDDCRIGEERIIVRGGGNNPDTHSWYNKESVNQERVGRFPANLIHDDSKAVADVLGDKARYFYSAKAGKKDRSEGLEDVKNTHPTVKPVDLMAYLCRLITPEGGTVLDPFTGSGSTGKAAIRECFNFIGIEMDPEYCEIAKARIEFEINKT